MTQTRHLLVIASQCFTMPTLPGLAEVANGLHDVFHDGELGGCRPGLPDGRSLLLLEDRTMTSADVYRAVREAIGHAAAHRATLVLALIGHGFVPGEDPTLYFMTPDSEDQLRDTAVNVGQLLLEASDRPGMTGVVGIVDTCNAAGAMVSVAQLTTGVRAGRTAVAVIMASAVGQDARDLNLSRELTTVLRAGSDSADAALFPHDVDTPLRARLGPQTLAVSTFLGQGGGQDAVWLTANPRHALRRNRGLVSSHSAARLAAGMRAVDASAVIPERWDEDALRRVKAWLGSQGPTPGAVWNLTSGPARIMLERLVDELLVAVRTAGFLQSWLRGALTTARLRTAVAGLRPGPGGNLIGVPGSAFSRVEDVVEHLAVNHPNPQEDCRGWICRFVIALAQQAGRALDAPELVAWAAGIDAEVPFGDALQNAEDRAKERQLRLIVSMHASPAGHWPPSLDAWLLDGTAPLAHDVFHNRAVPDRTGCEQALAEAVDWAEDRASDLAPEHELKRVEVAVPSTLLVGWRPEDAPPDRRLGVDYDIVLRWSLRLNPPSSRAWTDRRARNRWKRIASPAATAPVDWLSPRDTADPQELYDLLRDDHYAQAVGLDHHPGTLPASGSELLDLLLTFSPIVLWPEDQDGFPSHCQDVFNDYWHTLPVGLIDSYRKQWGRKAPADPADIVARLRAVWDDLEWLDFCATNRRMASVRQRGPQ